MSSVWMFLGGERKDDNKQRIVMGQRGESNRMIKYMGCLFVKSPFCSLRMHRMMMVQLYCRC